MPAQQRETTRALLALAEDRPRLLELSWADLIQTLVTEGDEIGLWTQAVHEIGAIRAQFGPTIKDAAGVHRRHRGPGFRRKDAPADGPRRPEAQKSSSPISG